MEEELILCLKADQRAMLAIAKSDKEVLDELRGKMPVWKFVRKMLAVYMTEVGDQESAA